MDKMSIKIFLILLEKHLERQKRKEKLEKIINNIKNKV